MSTATEVDVAVVGAGLAGLRCARELRDAGLDVAVWEAADAVGGRIRTDEVDGHLLDRGFQLLNPAYPAVGRWVDVDALRLGGFAAGVAARTDDGLLRLAHPLRKPGLLPPTLAAAATRPREVAAVVRWARPLLAAPIHRHDLAARLARRSDEPLADSLDRAGVHGVLRRVVDRFFAGVLLDGEGRTSTQYAQLLTWMFVIGVPGLPARGMQALPEQLSVGLTDVLRLSTPVERVERAGSSFVVHASDGATRARHVVVAADAAASARLLGGPAPATRGVVTHYFSTDVAPEHPTLLHVDARERPGPLVNVAVQSAAQPTYAPPGRHLVQASALLGPDGSGASEGELREQAGLLLGCSSAGWESVGRYEVRHALPAQPPPLVLHRPLRTDLGVVVAGDHHETASIQGALVSGHRAAQAVLAAPTG